MTSFEWTSVFLFFVLYIVMLFTICFLTFKKGHIVLGIVGIFIPFLWLIGAVIPAKPGSSYEREQRAKLK
ncbi:MAG: hypothetical protein C4536_00555 [Actinobacteria bacterium]|nr:MAG: hypothetical protein C4536_00555 [Actinomycetota bacterium]